MRDPKEIWTAWLEGSATYRSGRLRVTDQGSWQIVLDAAAFGDSPKVPLFRIGSYQLRDNYFIQIWCTDAATRQHALTKRSLGLATLPDVMCIEDLQERIRDLAAKLRVDEISIADLSRYARNTDDRRLARLDNLPHKRERQ